MLDNNVFMRWIIMSIIISVQVFIILYNVVPRYDTRAIMAKDGHPEYFVFNLHDGKWERW